jgi:hypothetical protein
MASTIVDALLDQDVFDIGHDCGVEGDEIHPTAPTQRA